MFAGIGASPVKALGILAGVGVVVAAVVLLIVVGLNSPTNLMDLRRGDCFNADLEVEVINDVEPVDCAADHLAEVIAIDELNPDRDRPYPSDDATLFSEGEAACRSAQPLVGEQFVVVPIPSNEAAWDTTAGRVLCVAVALGLVPTQGTAVVESSTEGG